MPDWMQLSQAFLIPLAIASLLPLLLVISWGGRLIYASVGRLHAELLAVRIELDEQGRKLDKILERLEQ